MDTSFERALAFAQDLIRTPGLPGREQDVADRVLAEYAALGFDQHRRDDVGNAIAIVRGRGERPPLMLSSHLDVVDVGDASSWEHAPFSGDIADGHLHGRGAMDIKGPLALQTYAAAQFLRDRPAGDIIVAHTIMEERGGWGMEFLMQAGALEPGAVIIGEATSGDICVGHRGRAELIVELEGLAGHASAPARARNPIDLLPAVVSALQEFAARQSSLPLLGAATIAPTALETLPRSRNVIPDRVRMVVDWRVLPGRTAEQLESELTEFLGARVRAPEGWQLRVYYSVEPQQTYTGLSRDRRMFTPGFLLQEEHVVVKAAADTIARHTGRAPAIRTWGFATDGGHTCGVHGIPTSGFAPGEERYAHTNRERLELASARVAYDAYPQLMRAVQQSLAAH
ncbi:MAG: M20 family metallopeptidase [Gemmatimonadota bacterium]